MREERSMKDKLIGITLIVGVLLVITALLFASSYLAQGPGGNL